MFPFSPRSRFYSSKDDRVTTGIAGGWGGKVGPTGRGPPPSRLLTFRNESQLGAGRVKGGAERKKKESWSQEERKVPVLSLLSALHTGSLDFTQPPPSHYHCTYPWGSAGPNSCLAKGSQDADPHWSQSACFVPHNHIVLFSNDVNNTFFFFNKTGIWYNILDTLAMADWGAERGKQRET